MDLKTHVNFLRGLGARIIGLNADTNFLRAGHSRCNAAPWDELAGGWRRDDRFVNLRKPCGSLCTRGLIVFLGNGHEDDTLDTA